MEGIFNASSCTTRPFKSSTRSCSGCPGRKSPVMLTSPVVADFSAYRLEHWLEKTVPLSKTDWITVYTARIPMDP